MIEQRRGNGDWTTAAISVTEYVRGYQIILEALSY